MPAPPPRSDSTAPTPGPKRFYSSLWVQVSVAIVIAVLFGYLSPERAVAMKEPQESHQVRVKSLKFYSTVWLNSASTAGAGDELRFDDRRSWLRTLQDFKHYPSRFSSYDVRVTKDGRKL